jgi:DNA-binding response OmpR family regulator
MNITGKARILLVEDESDVLRVNEQYLLQRGYEVHCADTLRKARNLIWEYPPDLILLDVLLPDGSGFELCESIRKNSAAPVIFLTCMGHTEHIVNGLSLGGDDYIVKPYSFEVLEARIAAQLRRRGIGSGLLELPPLSVSLTSGSVRLSGEEIPLNRKEFQLLVYLMENRGQELSQAQIYRAVWESPPDTMGNTVKMTISRLRQKLRLEETGCFELSTTTSQGYMFLRTGYPADL